MGPDHVIRELSETQHGVMHRRQLRRAGVPPESVARRVASGRLSPLSSTVLWWRGAPLTAESRDLAAVLDLGEIAALSHWSAAHRWGLPVGRPDRPHVCGPRNRNRRNEPLAMVHEPRSLAATHVTRLGALPITTPARTLFDIANLRHVHPERVERLVDATLATGLVTVSRLREVLQDLPTRGRRGRVAMRRIIESREHLAPMESNLEFRFNTLAKQAGFQALERQVDVGNGIDWIGRVDFVDRRRRVIFECDSERYHGSLTDRRADEFRRRRLAAEGWTVVSFSEVDLWHRGAEVVETLRTVRGRLWSSELAG